MVSHLKTHTTNGAARHRRSLRLSVRDVTGTHSAVVELDPQLRVGTVAETVAARLSLPADTAWALRDESTAAFLDDEKAIGDALETLDETEPALVVTPKAHLG